MSQHMHASSLWVFCLNLVIVFFFCLGLRRWRFCQWGFVCGVFVMWVFYQYLVEFAAKISVYALLPPCSHTNRSQLRYWFRPVIRFTARAKRKAKHGGQWRRKLRIEPLYLEGQLPSIIGRKSEAKHGRPSGRQFLAPTRPTDY